MSEKTIPTSVKLTKRERVFLRKIGGNNLTEGIRIAMKALGFGDKNTTVEIIKKVG